MSVGHRHETGVRSQVFVRPWHGVEVVHRGPGWMGGLAVGIFSLAAYVFSTDCLALAVGHMEQRDRYFTSEKPQTFRFALPSDAV